MDTQARSGTDRGAASSHRARTARAVRDADELPTLSALYRRHKRGKVSDKWASYLDAYERIFSGYRSRPIRLLEIGIQNGGSLDIWAKYFPMAQRIVGCDIDPNVAELTYADPRIAVIVGDANSDETWRAVRRHARKLELVIDDGSHVSRDVVRSFARYFPMLVYGGAYVVEDVHTSYWRAFQGGLYHPHSSMAFFKRLADTLNYEHWATGAAIRDLFAGFLTEYAVNLDEDELLSLHSVEFANSLCVIRKEKPARNRLARRIVAGDEARVAPDIVSRAGETLEPPDQRTNPWSAREMPPEEELPLRLAELADRDAELHRARETERALRERDLEVAQLAATGKAVVDELAAREAKLKAVSDELRTTRAAAEDLAMALRQKQSALASMETEVEGLRAQAEVAATILASHSWRLTEPLRRVGRVVRSVRRRATERHAPPSRDDQTNAAPSSASTATVAKRTRGTSAKSRPSCDPADVPYRIDHFAPIRPDDDLLLYAAYTPTGRLSPLHRRALAFLASAYRVILIINTDSFFSQLDPGANASAIQIVRGNVGFDFGAWAHATHLIGGVSACQSVTFTNDSLIGPLSEELGHELKRRISSAQHDVLFLTANREIRHHLQSYFFTIRSRGLRHGALAVVRDQPYLSSALDVVQQQEVPLASRFVDAGMDVGVIYDDGATRASRANPTIHQAQHLLSLGFPFLKVRLFSDGFLDPHSEQGLPADLEDWRDAVVSHLAERRARPLPPVAPEPTQPARAIPNATRLGTHGAVQAYNPSPGQVHIVPVPILIESDDGG